MKLKIITDHEADDDVKMRDVSSRMILIARVASGLLIGMKVMKADEDYH